MAELNDLENRLKKIPPTDWAPLFQLIPDIERATAFGEVIRSDPDRDGFYILPYMIPAPVVVDFHRLANALGIIPVFDWTRWKKGRDLLQDEQTEYTALSVIDLCKLLTVIFRTDRFSEGYLIACFEKGIILKILLALKHHIDGRAVD